MSGHHDGFEESEFPRSVFHVRSRRSSVVKNTLEHPENDLMSDADSANRIPPEPKDFDELADQPDPLKRAEENEKSSRQAWLFVLISFLGTAGYVIILTAIMHAMADPAQCETFGGRYLCSLEQQHVWAFFITLPAIGFLIANMVIMMRKLNRYLRWRPWMGVFWFQVPFSMYVFITAIQVYLATGPAI